LSLAQVKTSEKPPVFEGCENLDAQKTGYWLYNKLQECVFRNFEVPEVVDKEDYKANVIVLFQEDEQGEFTVLHTNASYQEVNQEINRVFDKLPKVSPPVHNGNPTYAKYTLTIAIPLQEPVPFSLDDSPEKPIFVKTKNKPLTELDSIVYHKFENPHLKSQLNIPFSHSYYAQFDRAMNQM